MRKQELSIVGIIVLGIILIIGFVAFIRTVLITIPAHDADTTDVVVGDGNTSAPVTPAFATYTVEGTQFTLHEGTVTQHHVSNSVISGKVTLLDTYAVADFDKDSRSDTAVILTHEPGGTGTFYYAAAAFQSEDSYVTSNTMLLGDRVVISGIDATLQGFNVRYLDRRVDQDFTIQPSVAKVARFVVDVATRTITKAPEIAQVQPTNADKLLGAPWKWVKTDIVYKSNRPSKPDVFTMTFNADGTFNFTTDCNGGGGTYTASHNVLEFGPIYTTLMACPRSEESEFVRMLGGTQTYRFDAPNYLVLEFYGGETHLTR
jgi:heat shock protein HslJ